MIIKDVKIGDSFIYNGHNYTKLNDNNLCIIDDYDDDFMQWVFDLTDNDYSHSLIRSYINSEGFINKLSINLNDVGFYNDDYLTLLSKEEYDEYRELVKNYDAFWWLRSGFYNSSNLVFSVKYGGGVGDGTISNSYGVRPALYLKPKVIVELKKEEK